jgi:hypothetical protein
MMAFIGGQRPDGASRLLAAQERRLERRSGANHDMTRLVGLPANRALAAFGHGDFATAARLLRALPPLAHRIGGSHAQRDLFTLILLDAAKKSGNAALAAELHQERARLRPAGQLPAALSQE